MNNRGDIDIDFGDRDVALKDLTHVPASIIRNNQLVKHASGVYFHEVPIDPILGLCSLDHRIAGKQNCYKIDFLNVSIYQEIRDENHLLQLMNQEPNWELLKNQSFCERITHIGKHYASIMKMPEPIDSIMKLAMFLAIIRPAKRKLIGKKWSEVEKTVWEKTTEGFSFKHSHSLAYATLVAVHINLISEQIVKPVDSIIVE